MKGILLPSSDVWNGLRHFAYDRNAAISCLKRARSRVEAIFTSRISGAFNFAHARWRKNSSGKLLLEGFKNFEPALCANGKNFTRLLSGSFRSEAQAGHPESVARQRLRGVAYAVPVGATLFE